MRAESFVDLSSAFFVLLPAMSHCTALFHDVSRSIWVLIGRVRKEFFYELTQEEKSRRDGIDQVPRLDSGLAE